MGEKEKKYPHMVLFCPIFLPGASGMCVCYVCMFVCYVCMFVCVHSHVRNKANVQAEKESFSWQSCTVISVTVPAIHPRSTCHCEQACGP